MPESDENDTTAIVACLSSDVDAIRCAALRTLAVLGVGVHRPAVRECLLDEDPDVRSDAMEVLALCATVEDVESITNSLIGDPVAEVKVAAVKALAHVADTSSLAILRRLACDRCDDYISWQDQNSSYDEWLDVQVAAIRALGTFGRAEVVDDICKARADEFAQNLDVVAFEALSKIPGDGVAALFELARKGKDCTRALAAKALLGASHSLVTPLAAHFAAAADPWLRILAIALLEPNSSYASELALNDCDPAVRSAALERFGAQRGDLVYQALKDIDESVVACALKVLTKLGDRPDSDNLLLNLQVWIHSAGAELAGQSARTLRKLYPEISVNDVENLAFNRERPLASRLVALELMACGSACDGSTEKLRSLLNDPVQQVRLAALRVVCHHARAGVTSCADLLAVVMMGEHLPISNDAGNGVTDKLSPVGLQGESFEETYIHILSNGQIETLPEDKEECMAVESSTLGVIQQANALTHYDEHMGASEHGVGTDRHRCVAIGGATHYQEDLQLGALRIGALVEGELFESCLLRALDDPSQLIHETALESLSLRAETYQLSHESLNRIAKEISNNSPIIRAHALRCLHAQIDVVPFTSDSDPLVRAIAYRALELAQRESLATGFLDPVEDVRRVVVDICAEQGDRASHIMTTGLSRCLDAGYQETLGHACNVSPTARSWVVAEIAQLDKNSHAVLILLNALSSVHLA